jgi:hypothetical protein
MGNVFLGLICVFSAAILFFFILNILYRKTNSHKNATINIQKYLDGVPNGLSVVNLGSTFAWYNINYNYFPVKGFNFALIPQSLGYDFKILKQYHGHINEHGVVLICLCSFVFLVDSYQDDNSNMKYYYFLNCEYINNYNPRKHTIYKKFPLFRNPLLVKRIIRDEPLRVKDSMLVNTEEYLSVTARNRITNWCKEFGFQDMYAYKSSEKINSITGKTVNRLCEMIDYCIKNSFSPVIVIAPVYKQYSGLLSDEMLKNCLYDNIVRANVQNIPVFDYFKDKRFQDCSLYINSDCLNKKGQELFNKVLVKDLSENGLL